MQCKDIPDTPILQFLASFPVAMTDGLYGGPWEAPWATLHSDFPNSVRNAMPCGVPDKLALAKMRSLIRRGLVQGCYCGCRGDFELTKKGREWLGR